MTEKRAEADPPSETKTDAASGGNPHDLFVGEIKQAFAQLGPAGEEAAMTAAQQLIQQGIEQGKPKWQREFLLKQLNLKFGAVSESVAARVNAADEAELEKLAGGVLTAATIDELFADE